MPEGLQYLQDALFQVLFATCMKVIVLFKALKQLQVMLANYENFSSPITELASIIKPRHVNLWLCHLNGTATAGYGYTMSSLPSVRAGYTRTALELIATAQHQVNCLHIPFVPHQQRSDTAMLKIAGCVRGSLGPESCGAHLCR